MSNDLTPANHADAQFIAAGPTPVVSPVGGSATYDAPFLPPLGANAYLPGLDVPDQHLFVRLDSYLHQCGFRNSAAILKAVNSFYRKACQELDGQQDRRDERDKGRAQKALQRKWGSQFGAKTNSIRAMFDALPESIGDALLDGRTDDGTLLLNDPIVAEFFALIADLMAPATLRTVSGQMQNEDDQAIARMTRQQIEKLIGDSASAYWKGPKAARMQAKYQSFFERDDE